MVCLIRRDFALARQLRRLASAGIPGALAGSQPAFASAVAGGVCSISDTGAAPRCASRAPAAW